MKIRVDHGKCTGLGVCESIAPNCFEVTEDGDLEVLIEDIADGDLEMIEQAVVGCPTFALSIEK
ncbi:ferredoxin [Nocardia sp. NPDC052278]|uniref:ferredoxin n=1 Tax=unclassified Nocardia TaxID=2637762 RepID=UPI00368113A2